MERSDSTRNGSPVIVVTGDRGTGKSTFLTKCITDAGTRMKVSGVVTSAAHDDHGQRTGLVATIYPGLHRVPLATIVDAEMQPPLSVPRHYDLALPADGVLVCRGDPSRPVIRLDTNHLGSRDDIFFGPYRFFTRSFSRIAEETSGAAGDWSHTGSDAVVIDEIGPIEIDHRRGFWDVLAAALGRAVPLIVTTRRECIDAISGLAQEAGRPAVVLDVPERASISDTVEYIIALSTAEDN